MMFSICKDNCERRLKRSFKEGGGQKKKNPTQEPTENFKLLLCLAIIGLFPYKTNEATFERNSTMSLASFRGMNPVIVSFCVSSPASLILVVF